MADTQSETHSCLYCAQTSEAVPLIALEYQGRTFWICPQHLPILIHNPQQLVGKLPDAETLQEADHQH